MNGFLFQPSQCFYVPGVNFWKGSRKVIAVPSSELNKKKYVADSSSSSDSEYEPIPKRARTSSVSDIDRNIKALRTQVDALFAVQGTLKLPLSLRKLLTDNFKCIICCNIMKPPVIFARCCKQILGCEACIDTWYRDEGSATSKTCPQCRAERAYAETCRLNGIDEFLEGVGKIFNSSAD
jgi:hypothetical protein